MTNLNNTPDGDTERPRLRKLEALTQRNRGRTSREAMKEWVRDALRYLDDPVSLSDESPLANLPVVDRLATTTFRGRTCPRGLALRALLRDALAAVSRDLEGTVLGDIAVALLQGRTQASVAEVRGFGDEWLSRRWKPVLLSLVLNRLLDAGTDERAKAA